MEKDSKENNAQSSSINNKKTFWVSLSILAVAALVTLFIFVSEPEAVREGASRKTAMLVDVVTTDKGNFSPTISSTGIIKAEQDIWLQPRVSGEVTRISNKFYPGEHVTKGTVLLQIDAADYKNALELRKGELAQAKANIDMEMGQQYVAEQDYQLLGDSIAVKNKSLVLRKPQLNAAKAQVQAAQAAVDRALLDLERTTIRAPFDAQIISRDVNLGSQVAPGQNMARLVGTNTYWVEASIPPAKIKWLRFPDDDHLHGATVKITSRTHWEKQQYRTGLLQKMIGALEDKTRMARVLITVEDPLALKTENNNPPLMIGAFLEIEIEGKPIANVIRLKRNYIRQNNTVWVMQDSVLHIKPVNIVTTDQEYAYINKGIDENDKVITTNLSTVVEGEPLRLTEKSEGSLKNQTKHKSQIK